jgi:metal-responsive CopG/Arc/MetJ family transcriptional regulator
MRQSVSRTTLTIPSDLLARADQAVREGKARSRNSLVAAALQHELEALDRAEIDAAFAPMADDLEYQTEVRQIAEEFALSDWEALEQSEERR